MVCSYFIKTEFTVSDKVTALPFHEEDGAESAPAATVGRQDLTVRKRCWAAVAQTTHTHRKQQTSRTASPVQRRASVRRVTVVLGMPTRVAMDRLTNLGCRVRERRGNTGNWP